MACKVSEDVIEMYVLGSLPEGDDELVEHLKVCRNASPDLPTRGLGHVPWTALLRIPPNSPFMDQAAMGRHVQCKLFGFRKVHFQVTKLPFILATNFTIDVRHVSDP